MPSGLERSELPPSRALGLVLAAALACVPSQSGEQREQAAGPSEVVAASAEPECASPGEGVLALLEGDSEAHPCGLALVLEGDELQLRAITRADPSEPPSEPPSGATVLGRGSAPAACGEGLGGCELWGLLDALGPLVFAAVRGPESEVPTQVYLGFVEGERLAFVETWYGLPSVGDHTRLGPPWALAPFDCGGELSLLPAPRLIEAGDEPVGETLRALAGHWRVGEDGEAQAPAEPSPVDPSSCRALTPAP